MAQKLFVAQHHAEAHLLCGLLQAEGITAEVRREFLFTTMEASTLIPGMRPEVWIEEPAQGERALRVVEAFAARPYAHPEAGLPWHCWNCGEAHEPQFTHCWRCGATRARAGLDGAPLPA